MKSRIDRFHLGMTDDFIVIVALCDTIDLGCYLANRLVLHHRALAEYDVLFFPLYRYDQYVHHDPSQSGKIIASCRLLRAEGALGA